MRKQPISPVTDPLQFRAIGLVRGTYRPESPDCFTSGMIHAMDDTQLEAVLLGRVIHLLRRYVDLDQPHLWVCYPRNRDKDKSKLHLQVMGIWEPSLLDRADETLQNDGPVPKAIGPETPEPPDGYFSVRGELMFTDPEAQQLLVKIRQQPRANATKRARSFKLMLHGVVPPRALRHFLNLDLQRHGQSLHVEHYDVIQPMVRGRMGRGQGGRGRMPASRRPMARPSQPGVSVRPGRPRPGILKRFKPEA
ncbi:MAG: hypothetical protein TH68_10950 [Candidatus Synechococcus spongiarum 142]|uniref:Uncharacterized protein n=1 Tax=Candidatus Synechococcus spongiarum 142 TaxID=1608213 RepID=A0A6N3X913_9SYNE|nr:MAG: hypothetical protein TH68_10950 [Candidatus Synechococcus spongiarum 142]